MTLSAEGQSAGLNVERGNYLEMLLQDAADENFLLTNPQHKLPKSTGVLGIDAKTLII